MKRTVFSFTAGILIGALLFSGAAAYAAGVMAERSTNRVFVDGREVQIEAYNITGNNYCKLRDIGKAVGFNVTWDAAENAVRINTGEPYAEDTPAQALRVVQLPTDGSCASSHVRLPDEPYVLFVDYAENVFLRIMPAHALFPP